MSSTVDFHNTCPHSMNRAILKRHVVTQGQVVVLDVQVQECQRSENQELHHGEIAVYQTRASLRVTLLQAPPPLGKEEERRAQGPDDDADGLLEVLVEVVVTVAGKKLSPVLHEAS